MDKSILNVAGLISFVLGIICCCTIFGAIVGIPMIIGGNKLREISNMSDEDIINLEILTLVLIWTIVLLLLCTISGILALIFYISLENPNGFNFKASNSKKYDDLEKLNQLYKDKVLTKEEFEAEKNRILENK